MEGGDPLAHADGVTNWPQPVGPTTAPSANTVRPRTIVRTYETVAVEMPPMPTEDPSMFPPEETPVPEEEPEPTFAEILGKGLLGLLGLGS